MRDRPQGAYLFPSRENKAKYRNKPLVPDSLRQAYVRVIEEQFPKLLEDPTKTPEERRIIESLISNKPHYPYLFRHEFASEYAPKLSRLSFNQLIGHSESSKMQDVYVQSLGNEGNTELQIVRGVRAREDTITPAQAQLQPKYCVICGEANKQSADFCFKCNWAISSKGAMEERERNEAAAKESEIMKKKLDVMTVNIESSFELIGKDNQLLKEHGIRRKDGEGIINYLEVDDEGRIS
jgi:hypothetical protein